MAFLDPRHTQAGFNFIMGSMPSGRFAGSPLTELFILEDTIRQSGKIIQFPAKSVTDAVIKEGRYEDDQDTFSSPYHSNFSNKNSNFGINTDTGTPDVVTKISYVNQIFGQQPLVPIHNPLLKSEAVGVPQFTTQLTYDPLNKDYPALLQIRRITNAADTSPFPVHFLGNLYGDFRNPSI